MSIRYTTLPPRRTFPTRTLRGKRPVDISLEVNGSTEHLDVDPGVTLLDALRERLDVTGPKKGCEPNTVATLRATRSIQAIYQLHRNIRPDGATGNVSDPTWIANQNEKCEGKRPCCAAAGSAAKRARSRSQALV